eukprot:scaffold22650_cov55-Phaeocystis_antarctica.AAC.7
MVVPAPLSSPEGQLETHAGSWSLSDSLIAMSAYRPDLVASTPVVASARWCCRLLIVRLPTVMASESERPTKTGPVGVIAASYAWSLPVPPMAAAHSAVPSDAWYLPMKAA